VTSDAPRGRPERSRGREAALQLLYRAEVGGLEAGDDLAGYWDEVSDYLDGEAGEASRTFAEEIFTGVRAEQPALDAFISSALERWRLDRVARIDRLILRIAAFELRRALDPPAVVIDESLELARRFGGDDSVRFINGVVDGMRKRL